MGKPGFGHRSQGAIGFRAKLMPGRLPNGYNTLLNTLTHIDKTGTGSLAINRNVSVSGAKVVPKTNHIRPLEWFRIEVIAKKNYIVIKVNDHITADYRDPQSSFSKGHIALMNVWGKSSLRFRKIELKELPSEN